MKKVYEIECTLNYATMRIEVDHDIVTDEILTSINSFWSGDKSRIEEAGSLLNAVLKLIAQEAFREMFSENWNTCGIVSHFWDDTTKRGVEGFPPMDGSSGFKILNIESCDIEKEDLTVTEK